MSNGPIKYEPGMEPIWKLTDPESSVCLSLPRGLGCAPQDGKVVHRHSDDTWWFWDETWCDEIGPYKSEERCNKAAASYGESL